MDSFVDISTSAKVKEEPFEEFLFPETILDSANGFVESCCFLCPKGKEILLSLNDHQGEFYFEYEMIEIN